MAERKRLPPFFPVFRTVAARADLRPAAKLVHAYIVGMLQRNTECYAGLRTIADALGMDEKTVRRSVGVLEDTGDIGVDRRGIGRSNRYYLPSDGEAKRGQNVHTSETQSAGSMPTLPTDGVRAKCPDPLGKMSTQARAKCPPTRKRKLNRDKSASRKRAASTSHLPAAPPEPPDGPSSPWTRDRNPPRESNAPASLVYRMAVVAEEILGSPFSPTWGRDGKALNSHLHLGGDEIEKRWRAFLEQSRGDKYLRSHRTIAYFAANINSYVAEASEYDRELAKAMGATS